MNLNPNSLEASNEYSFCSQGSTSKIKPQNSIIQHTLKNPKMIETLLQLSTAEDIPLVIQKNSVFVLKKVLLECSPTTLDKHSQIFRQTCVGQLANCSSLAIGQSLVDLAIDLLRRFGPSHWPFFDNQIARVLDDNRSSGAIFWALSLFLELCREREFDSLDSEFVAKDDSLEIVLPRVERIFSQMLKESICRRNSIIMELVAKIFHSCTRFHIPTRLLRPDINEFWMNQLTSALRLTSQDPVCQGRLKSIKMWSIRALTQYHNKHMHAKFRKFRFKFSLNHLSKYSVPIIDALLNEIIHFGRTGIQKNDFNFASSIFDFLQNLQQIPLALSSLQNVFLDIIEEITLPMLIRHKHLLEADTHRTRPWELVFLRQNSLYFSENFATSVLKFMISIYANNLDHFQNLLESRLSDNELASDHKEVLYLVFQHLVPQFRQRKIKRVFLAQVVDQFLIRDLMSVDVTLQIRCCLVILQMIPYRISGPSSQTVFQSCCWLMAHPDLSLRVASARVLIVSTTTESVSALSPFYLQQVVIALLHLIPQFEEYRFVELLDEWLLAARSRLRTFGVEIFADVVKLGLWALQRLQSKTPNNAGFGQKILRVTLRLVGQVIESLQDQITGGKMMDDVLTLLDPFLSEGSNDLQWNFFKSVFECFTCLSGKLTHFLHSGVLRVANLFLHAMAVFDDQYQSSDTKPHIISLDSNLFGSNIICILKFLNGLISN